MRTDYILYAVAIIFFAITAMVYAFTVEFKELWIIGTAVLGLFFAGLGIFQTTRTRTAPVETAPPATVVVPPPAPAPQATQTPPLEVVEKEESKTVIEAAANVETTTPAIDITQVKGVKAKRAEQLKAQGINSVEDLANASAKEIGKKLEISPKIAEKWIADAKALLEKSKK